MNNQLWLTNSLLLGAMIAALGYLSFARLNVPSKAHLSVIDDVVVEEEGPPVVHKIYERDFFNAMPVIPDEEKIPLYVPKTFIVMPAFPAPPQRVKEDDFVFAEPQFLPPLPLTLKGTIMSNNSVQNRVFIENNKTKEEISIRLGDIIEDAQVVFIGKNKVILIRSNGQEETLYTNSIIGQEEKNISSLMPWSKIITQKSDNEYLFNVELLIKRNPTISHFIESLGLVTCFEGVLPIGCQVGIVNDASLAHAIGLKSHDIVLKINNISTATPEDRIKIYQSIMSYPDKLITVSIKRNGSEVINYYSPKESTLTVSSHSGKVKGISGFSEKVTKKDSSYKKYQVRNQLDSSESYAKTAQNEIRKNHQEKTKMGSRDSALNRKTNNTMIS